MLDKPLYDGERKNEQTGSIRAFLLQLIKKFLAFYGTRLFITMFTRVSPTPHLSLSWARLIHSTNSHRYFLTPF